MNRQTIFKLSTIYRDEMHVDGFVFGSGEKSACILGGIRGNEMQQMYACATLIKKLAEIENTGGFAEGKSVMVVPAVNTYSMNIEKRFWPTDNTDVNRMFPGYKLGETTQRIAAGVFDAVQGYKYGIHFASNYLPGRFAPHIRMMQTGYEDVEAAKLFGLSYVVLRNPKPYDTTTLNYNWQLWDTKAFSVFSNSTDTIDKANIDVIVRAVLNFLANAGIIKYNDRRGYISTVFNESALVTLKAQTAGIFECLVNADDFVNKGDVLARIMDPFTAEVKTEITAPVDSTVFFVQSGTMAYANASLFKLLPTK
ncbi:MAG: M14 family metallopeptidase [Candidatus Ornithomonoglobus sp.]